MSRNRTITQLDSLLKPLGFVRQQTTWNRRADTLVDVVDVQVSKAGDAMTVNAGVLDSDVRRILWGTEPSDFVDQPSCTICTRIGELIDGKEVWWQLGNRETADEVVEKVAAHVLPFLARMHAREAMEQWLVHTQVAKKRYPPPIISLAILKSFLGKGAEACALLADLEEKSTGPWRTRTAEVAARLGCV